MEPRYGDPMFSFLDPVIRAMAEAGDVEGLALLFRVMQMVTETLR